MLNQEVPNELHKPIIRKFGKQKVHSSFMDNFQNADLANMQLISKFRKRSLLFIIYYWYFHYIYTLVIPLKAKEGITITCDFQKNVDESSRRVAKSEGHTSQKRYD